MTAKTPTVYETRVLRSMREICEVLGVGRATVKKWWKCGAPIAFERDAQGVNGRYSAELASLQQWRVARSEKT